MCGPSPLSQYLTSHSQKLLFWVRIFFLPATSGPSSQHFWPPLWSTLSDLSHKVSSSGGQSCEPAETQRIPPASPPQKKPTWWTWGFLLQKFSTMFAKESTLVNAKICNIATWWFLKSLRLLVWQVIICVFILCIRRGGSLKESGEENKSIRLEGDIYK